MCCVCSCQGLCCAARLTTPTATPPPPAVLPTTASANPRGSHALEQGGQATSEGGRGGAYGHDSRPEAPSLLPGSPWGSTCQLPKRLRPPAHRPGRRAKPPGQCPSKTWALGGVWGAAVLWWCSGGGSTVSTDGLHGPCPGTHHLNTSQAPPIAAVSTEAPCP